MLPTFDPICCASTLSMTMRVPGEAGGGVAQMRRVLRACARTPNPPCACAHPVLLQGMFTDAKVFDQNISKWDVRKVTTMAVRAIAIIISYDKHM